MLTLLAEWGAACGLANALGISALDFCAASQFELDQVNGSAVDNLELLVEREILEVGSEVMHMLAMVHSKASNDSTVAVSAAEVVIKDFSPREVLLSLCNQLG